MYTFPLIHACNTVRARILTILWSFKLSRPYFGCLLNHIVFHTYFYMITNTSVKVHSSAYFNNLMVILNWHALGLVAYLTTFLDFIYLLLHSYLYEV